MSDTHQIQPAPPKRRSRDKLIVVGVAILVGASLITALKVGAFRSSRVKVAGSVLTRSDPAPEFEGISRWINSSPQTLGTLRGKVVLIDFWTYSCINCIREIPELQALYGAYKAAGLEIVGVHSPEFEFEKIPSNVERAVAERKVTWPVAMDNGLSTWDAYDNHYWPHVYVLDRTGRIRYDHIGEGGTGEIESSIRELLGPSAALPSGNAAEGYSLNDGITREIYLGFERGEQGGFLGNAGGYHKREAATYRLPSRFDGRDQFYLAGTWTALGESLEAGPSARIVLPFTARDVYIVAGSGAAPGQIRVMIDGSPVDAKRSGRSVVGGLMKLAGKDLYHLVHLSGVESHKLELSVPAGASVYTFTFG